MLCQSISIYFEDAIHVESYSVLPFDTVYFLLGIKAFEICPNVNVFYIGEPPYSLVFASTVLSTTDQILKKVFADVYYIGRSIMVLSILNI